MKLSNPSLPSSSISMALISRIDSKSGQFQKLQDVVVEMRSKDVMKKLHAVIKLRNNIQSFAGQSTHWMTFLKLVSNIIELTVQADSPQLQFESLWTLTNYFAISDSKVEKLLEQFLPQMMELSSSRHLPIILQFIWLLGNLTASSHKQMHNMTIFHILFEIAQQHDCMLLFDRICWIYPRLNLLNSTASQVVQAKKKLFLYIITRFMSTPSIQFTRSNIKNIFNCLSMKEWQREEGKFSNLLHFSQILQHHDGLLTQLIFNTYSDLISKDHDHLLDDLCKMFDKFVNLPLGRQILQIILKKMQIQNADKTNKQNFEIVFYLNQKLRIQKKKKYLQCLISMLNCEEKRNQIAHMILERQDLMDIVLPGQGNKLQLENAEQIFSILQKLVENGKVHSVCKLVASRQVISRLLNRVSLMLMNIETMIKAHEIVFKILVKASQAKISHRRIILNAYLQFMQWNQRAEDELRTTENEVLQRY